MYGLLRFRYYYIYNIYVWVIPWIRVILSWPLEKVCYNQPSRNLTSRQVESYKYREIPVKSQSVNSVAPGVSSNLLQVLLCRVIYSNVIKLLQHYFYH